MKKLLIFLFFCQTVAAQDSVRVTISPQVRDLEYIAFYIFNDNAVEDIYDSLKVRFRVQSPPTGNTPVSCTAYAADWLSIITRLKTDQIAIKANCTSRIETLLRAASVYITGKLNIIDVADSDQFQAIRQFGRSKLRRQ
jgi:hypothetical protein